MTDGVHTVPMNHKKVDRARLTAPPASISAIFVVSPDKASFDLCSNHQMRISQKDIFNSVNGRLRPHLTSSGCYAQLL